MMPATRRSASLLVSARGSAARFPASSVSFLHKGAAGVSRRFSASLSPFSCSAFVSPSCPMASSSPFSPPHFSSLVSSPSSPSAGFPRSASSSASSFPPCSSAGVPKVSCLKLSCGERQQEGEPSLPRSAEERKATNRRELECLRALQSAVAEREAEADGGWTTWRGVSQRTWKQKRPALLSSRITAAMSLEEEDSTSGPRGDEEERERRSGVCGERGQNGGEKLGRVQGVSTGDSESRTRCCRGLHFSPQTNRFFVVLLSCLLFFLVGEVQEVCPPSLQRMESSTDFFFFKIASAEAHTANPGDSSKSRRRSPRSSRFTSKASSDSSSSSRSSADSSSSSRSSADSSSSSRSSADSSSSHPSSSSSSPLSSSPDSSPEEVNGLRGRARVWTRRGGLSSRLREFLSDASALRSQESAADAVEEARARVRLLSRFARSRRQTLEALGGKSRRSEWRRKRTGMMASEARESHRGRDLNTLADREKKALKSALLAAQLSRRRMQSIQSERSLYSLVRPLLDESDAAGVYTANECVAVRYADYPKEFPGYDISTESCRCPDGWLPCAESDAVARMSAWEPVIWEENADEGCTSERGEVMLEHMNFYSCPQRTFVEYTGPRDATIRDKQCKRVAFVLCRAATSSCITGPWSEWTSCSVPCGEGYQYRWRIPVTGASSSTDKGAVTQRSSREACAPYHMEERRKCNLGACPEKITKTTCFWTTVQVDRAEGAFDEDQGSCKCGTGDDAIDREEGAMVPCTPEEAVASMDNWKSHFRQHCYTSLGLRRRSNLALRFHSYGHVVRLGLRDLWHLDCTGGWSKFNIFEAKMFCGVGAKILCRSRTDSAQVPFSMEQHNAESDAVTRISMLLKRQRRVEEASPQAFAEESLLLSEGGVSHLWISLFAGAVAAVVFLVCLTKRAAVGTFLRSRVSTATAGGETVSAKGSTRGSRNAGRRVFSAQAVREAVEERVHAFVAFARSQTTAVILATEKWMETAAEREVTQEMQGVSTASLRLLERDCKEREERDSARKSCPQEAKGLLEGEEDVPALLVFPALKTATDRVVRVARSTLSLETRSFSGAQRSAQRLWGKVRSIFLARGKEKRDEDLFYGEEGERGRIQRGGPAAFVSSLACQKVERRRARRGRREGDSGEGGDCGEARKANSGVAGRLDSLTEMERDDSFVLSAVEEKLLFPRGKRNTQEKLARINKAARTAAVSAVTPESFGSM
ncbi:thrombospondin type 1 domain-containing protein [Toxoplasma gondii RUB]|uniref:Thrombospondin type 1 domain-containing protein n=1 Tax=Toxoplasma gondii RUB TaxID=935652 RepID=A0A086LPQ2_TOXGO|nr:thrombospondin type 1 domain-containing protein [Toxoplasma gondii RUB]